MRIPALAVTSAPHSGIDVYLVLEICCGIALLVILGFVVRVRLSEYRYRRQLARSIREPTLDRKLKELSDVSSRAFELVNDVRVEIDTQIKRADEAVSLAVISEQEQEVFATLVDRRVRSALEQSGKRERRVALGLNIGFFLAGAAVSVIVVLFIHPLT
jgi:hypothetical protein